MLPASSVASAALRWLRLLRVSTIGEAHSLIRANAAFTDLTQTQYSLALEWLSRLGVLVVDEGVLRLAANLTELSDRQYGQLLFERELEATMPVWLPDADYLVPDPTELPQDASALASALGISDQEAFLGVRHVCGRVDAAQLALVGTAGERALIRYLEAWLPGSTVHVSATDDGFGYDVSFNPVGVEWHLEVKTTTRRGRLVINLSRHEHEVGLRDPRWRLIVVGLDDRMELAAVATVRHREVLGRAPVDQTTQAKWGAAVHQLRVTDLQYGLGFAELKVPGFSSIRSPDQCGGSTAYTFAWMPVEEPLTNFVDAGR